MTSRLEAFFAWLRDTNPFLTNRVSRPAAAPDVPAIHGAEFRRLTDLARQAREQRCGLGAVLWGDPGTGKSHLLGRLARWADEGPGRAYCFYLYNLQARPDRLSRYLLKCVVSTLVRGRDRGFHGTPLYDLARAVLCEAVPDAAARRSLPRIAAGYRALLDCLAADDPARVDRDAFAVLLRFYLSANVAHYYGRDDGVAGLAVRWLSGEPLDPGEARRLVLRPDDPAAPPDNEQVKRILLALTQAALYRGRTVLLCLDQPAENADPEQVSALTRFLHDLLDSAANLLVITSSVEGTLRRCRQRGDITEAAWHRIAQFAVPLSFLTPDQARAVVAARLGPALGPFGDVAEVRDKLGQDPLFPLGGAWLEERLRGRLELRPRQVIDWARERWEAQQEALAADPAGWLDRWAAAPPRPRPPMGLAARIDEQVAEALAALRAQRPPHTLPPDGDHLARLVLSLLKQDLPHAAGSALLDVEEPAPTRPGGNPTYDLVVHRRDRDAREARLGLLFLANASAWSTASYLRRLAEDARPPERVLLVTDERQGLALGNSQDAKGRQYLAELRARGDAFRHLNLTFSQYAELDALLAVLHQAAAGDLQVSLDGTTRPVTEREVVASRPWRESCLAHPLLRLLLGAEDGGEPPPAENRAAVPERVQELVRAHETALRETITACLDLEPQASRRDLAVRCQRDLRRSRQVEADLATCEAAVGEVVARMREAGLVPVTADGI